jgi:nucleotide-binding universal stress UspA family protein
MWSIKKILVPTDFSRPSEAALHAAIALAKKFDASIVLLHAYQIPVYAYPTTPIAPVAEITSHVEQSASNALASTARACAPTGIAITTALHVGVPWEQILKAARQHEVDVIVMGSRGLRGLPRALMGSTAERVVRYSEIPVMTIHGTSLVAPEGKPTEDAIEHWIT